MPIITEVRFAHEDGALVDTLDSLPELELSVIPEAGTDPERSVHLFRAETEPDDDVAAALERDHTVADFERVGLLDHDRTFGVTFTPETVLMSPRVTARDGFVLAARSTVRQSSPRGWHERWLLPDREALHDIWQEARADGFEFDVLEFYQQGGNDPERPGPHDLTDQQREALVAAYEHGYFLEPREASLEELAAELDLSPTAVAGRIKRGMRSLVEMTVVGERAGR